MDGIGEVDNPQTKLTIDDLGPKPSDNLVRWLEEKEKLGFLDKRGAAEVPSKTQTTILEPHTPFDLKLVGRTPGPSHFSEFEAPKTRGDIFSHILIPSIGDDLEIEEFIKKLEAIKRKKKGPKPEKEDIEKVSSALQTLKKFSKDGIEIDNRRKEFSKG